MARAENDDFQLYLSRIRPIYHQLFNMAHAITGSCDAAEYSLQCAMMEFWSASVPSQHGFREGLRNTLIHAAMRNVQNPGEFSWDGLYSEDAVESDPIRRLIAQESPELRRVLALKYGCGLSYSRIGRIMDIEPRRIQTALSRFDARAKRKLDGNLRKRCESLIQQAIRSDFNSPSLLAPDMGSVFRTFQVDAVAMTKPTRLPSKILNAVLAAILALICMLGFWLAAVLMQPPVLEEPTQIVEITEE